jgi:glutaredoxin
MTLSTSSLLSAAARLGTAALLLGAAGAALAQYKIVGPDGRVTYTDKPPTAAEMRAANGGTAGADNAGGGLPYEVRQAAGRYPVTLYAQKACDPCDQARKALRARGVPFNEYSITTDGDASQLKSRFGEMSLPVVTIGSQTIKGFRQSDLDAYLDAAGYPKQARLAGYSWPAAVPLAPAAPATAKTAPAATAPSANDRNIDLPAPSKNGIQF